GTSNRLSRLFLLEVRHAGLLARPWGRAARHSRRTDAELDAPQAAWRRCIPTGNGAPDHACAALRRRAQAGRGRWSSSAWLTRDLPRCAWVGAAVRDAAAPPCGSVPPAARSSCRGVILAGAIEAARSDRNHADEDADGKAGD